MSIDAKVHLTGPSNCKIVMILATLTAQLRSVMMHAESQFQGLQLTPQPAKCPTLIDQLRIGFFTPDRVHVAHDHLEPRFGGHLGTRHQALNNPIRPICVKSASRVQAHRTQPFSPEFGRKLGVLFGVHRIEIPLGIIIAGIPQTRKHLVEVGVHILALTLVILPPAIELTPYHPSGLRLRRPQRHPSHRQRRSAQKISTRPHAHRPTKIRIRPPSKVQNQIRKH